MAGDGAAKLIPVLAVVGSPTPNPHSNRHPLLTGVIDGAVAVEDAEAPLLSEVAVTSSGVTVSAPWTATATTADRPLVVDPVGLASPACITRRKTAIADEVFDPDANDATTAVQPVGVLITPLVARRSQNR
jgi:hypothetical protein